jgi:hypothetical protein
VGGQAVRRPEPLDGGFAQARLAGHFPYAPGPYMRGRGRSQSKRFAAGRRRDPYLASRPGASARPASPEPLQRTRHLLTEARLVFRLSAISRALRPSARPKMSRARKASRSLVVDAWARRRKFFYLIGIYDNRSKSGHEAKLNPIRSLCKSICGTSH